MGQEKKCPKCGGSLFTHLGNCECDLDFCYGQRCGAIEKRGKLVCSKCSYIAEDNS